MAQYQRKHPLELWHDDLCATISPATYRGKLYFLLLVDDCIRYTWMALLHTKDEDFEVFKRIKAAIEMEKNLRLRALCTDRGDEFTSNEFVDYCELLGVKCYLKTPCSP